MDFHHLSLVAMTELMLVQMLKRERSMNFVPESIFLAAFVIILLNSQQFTIPVV